MGKDVTQEAFRNEDPRLGYFGQHAGPGPTVSRAVVAGLIDEPRDEPRDAELLGMGAFFDLWIWLIHWLIRLGLVLAMRHLSILEPLVVVAESREVTDRLLLAGPFLGDLPVPGAWPTEEELGAVVDATLPFGGLPWSMCQGRPFIARCGIGKFCLLVPVGHGGRVKYDPVLESEVVRLLVLSNKAALLTVSVACSYAREHGRPEPGDLGQWQDLLNLVKAKLHSTGLDSALEEAQQELRDKGRWIWSRRQRSARQRRAGEHGSDGAGQDAVPSENDVDFDDLDIGDMDHLDFADPEPDAEDDKVTSARPRVRTGTVLHYKGPKRDTERKIQFNHLATWLDDFRSRGIDEEILPNVLCPPWITNRDEWRRDFLESAYGVPIRVSIGNRSQGTRRRATTNRAKAGKLTMTSALASASASAASSTPAASSSSTPAAASSMTPTELGLAVVAPTNSKTWQCIADTRGMVQQLATEASIDDKGLQVAGCVDCHEGVVIKIDRRLLYYDWCHFCGGERPSGDIKAVEYRASCWTAPLFFASDIFRFPALQAQVGDAVDYHDLANVLERIKDRSSAVNWMADLVPPGFVVPADAPKVMVAKRSSEEWIAFNGVALANRLTLGAFPEVENSRTDTKAASRAITTAVGRAREAGADSIGINKCTFTGCDYAVFNGKPGGGALDHVCRRPGTGRASMPTFKRYTSVFQLPAPVRVALLLWLRVQHKDSYADKILAVFRWGRPDGTQGPSSTPGVAAQGLSGGKGGKQAASSTGASGTKAARSGGSSGKRKAPATASTSTKKGRK